MIRRIVFAAAALAAIGIAAAPAPASARGGVSFSIGVGPGWYAPWGGWRPYRPYWGPRFGVGIVVPPVVFAPPPVYYAPPAYAGPTPGAFVPQSVGQVLETVPTGTSATLGGQVTTPIRTWQNGGTWCREYTTTGRIAGRSQQLFGTACRDPGGAWRIVS
jgi:hypothetical protein